MRVRVELDLHFAVWVTVLQSTLMQLLSAFTIRDRVVGMYFHKPTHSA